MQLGLAEKGAAVSIGTKGPHVICPCSLPPNGAVRLLWHRCCVSDRAGTWEAGNARPRLHARLLLGTASAGTQQRSPGNAEELRLWLRR